MRWDVRFEIDNLPYLLNEKTEMKSLPNILFRYFSSSSSASLSLSLRWNIAIQDCHKDSISIAFNRIETIDPVYFISMKNEFIAAFLMARINDCCSSHWTLSVLTESLNFVCESSLLKVFQYCVRGFSFLYTETKIHVGRLVV